MAIPFVSQDILNKMHAMAEKSTSTYRLGGVAISKKGEILGFARNKPHGKDDIPPGKYSGEHVEAALIRRYRDNIKTIVIMRIGNAGVVRPIDPCPKCRKLAAKYNIDIVSIKPGQGSEENSEDSEGEE